MLTQPVIPERFACAVDEHLVFNLLGVEHWPLILGVFGRPGDGKSFQIRTHLERRGVLTVSINAADLESDRAGTAWEVGSGKYKKPATGSTRAPPAALLVDDFDTTIGEWDNSTTTVNHQQVLAQLMHLADSPPRRRATAQAHAGLYHRQRPVQDLPTARRPGRMRAFPWLPTDVERQDIVAAILAGALAPAETARNSAKLPEAPIAFFSDLLVDIIATPRPPRLGVRGQDLRTATRKAGRARSEQLEST